MDWWTIGPTHRYLTLTAVSTLSSLAAQGQGLPGHLDTSSVATIALNLEKRDAEGAITGVYYPQQGVMPVVFPEAELKALLESNSTRFPLCILSGNANGLTLDRVTDTADSPSLKSANGEKIPYSVRLAGRVQSSQPSTQTNACESGSLIEVELTIPKSEPRPRAALFGVIQLLMGNE